MNTTELIRSLTEINRIKIAELEALMRPGRLSRSGFRGKDERLLDSHGRGQRALKTWPPFAQSRSSKHCHQVCPQVKRGSAFSAHFRRNSGSMFLGKFRSSRIECRKFKAMFF